MQRRRTVPAFKVLMGLIVVEALTHKEESKHVTRYIYKHRAHT